MENMLTKENFQCDRYCGECCKKPVVRVRKAEIEKIRKLGYKEEDFLERDMRSISIFLLKRNKKGCIFLKKHKDGKYSCTIYKNRPKICQQYPFFRKTTIGSCLPNKMFPNAVFKFGNSSKIK